MARAHDLEERRDLAIAEAHVDIRAVDDAQRFFGHAAVFNERTAIGNPLRWGFYEQIDPGTFTKTLSEGDARMLIDHDSYYVVSRVSAGTLLLAQDVRGLQTDSALDEELSYVKDLKANLRNGNITGMSFGFIVTKDDWDEEEIETSDGNTATVEVRTIKEVKLIEVSAVSFPAYESTDAGLRSVRTALLARRDVEAIRRRAQYKPELAELLDQLDANRTTISISTNSTSSTTSASSPPVEVITSTEPGESTREDEQEAQVTEEAPEPVASTPNRPTDLALAAARLRVLKTTLRPPAA